MLRCKEGPENTTYRSDGQEALRAVVEAWKDREVGEESGRRLVGMLLVLCEVHRGMECSDVAGPEDDDHFLEMLSREEFGRIYKEILETEGFETITPRPSCGGPGGKGSRTRKRNGSNG